MNPKKENKTKQNENKTKNTQFGCLPKGFVVIVTLSVCSEKTKQKNKNKTKNTQFGCLPNSFAMIVTQSVCSLGAFFGSYFLFFFFFFLRAWLVLEDVGRVFLVLPKEQQQPKQ